MLASTMCICGTPPAVCPVAWWMRQSHHVCPPMVPCIYPPAQPLLLEEVKLGSLLCLHAIRGPKTCSVPVQCAFMFLNIIISNMRSETLNDFPSPAHDL